MSEPTYILKVTLKLDEDRQNTIVTEARREEIGKGAENCTWLLDAWAEEMKRDAAVDS